MDLTYIFKKFILPSPNFWFFMITTLVCIGLTLRTQNKIVKTVDEYEKRIMDLYEVASIERTSNAPIICMDSIDAIMKGPGKIKQKEESVLNYCISKIDAYTQNEITKNEASCTSYASEIKYLLESQHVRLRQEYEALQTWCAILTIVFLIFSFFSLYKADDMVKQGQKGVTDILSLKRDGMNTLSKLQTDAEESVRTLQQAIGTEIIEMNAKINTVNKRVDDSIVSIDEKLTQKKREMDSFILLKQGEVDKQMNAKVSEVEEKIDKQKFYLDEINKRLQSLQSKLELYDIVINK